MDSSCRSTPSAALSLSSTVICLTANPPRKFSPTSVFRVYPSARARNVDKEGLSIARAMKLPSVRLAAASVAVLTAALFAVCRIRRKPLPRTGRCDSDNSKMQSAAAPPVLSESVYLPLNIATVLESSGTALSAEVMTPTVAVMFFTPPVGECSTLAISHAFVFVEDLCDLVRWPSGESGNMPTSDSALTVDHYLSITQCAFFRSQERSANGSSSAGVVVPLNSYQVATGCAASHAVVGRSLLALVGCDAGNALGFGLVLVLEPREVQSDSSARGDSPSPELLVQSVVQSSKWAALIAELSVAAGRCGDRRGGGGTIRALVTRQTNHSSPPGRLWLSASAEHVRHATGITVAFDRIVPSLTYVNTVSLEVVAADLREVSSAAAPASESAPSERLIHCDAAAPDGTAVECPGLLVASSSGLLLNSDAMDDALVLSYLHNPMGVSFQLLPGAAVDQVAWAAPGKAALQYVLHPREISTTPIVRMEKWARLPSKLDELIRNAVDDGDNPCSASVVSEYLREELMGGVHQPNIHHGTHGNLLTVHEVTAFGRHAWTYEESSDVHRCRTYLCFTSGATVKSSDHMFLLRWETPKSEWERYGAELRNFLDTLHVAL